MQIEKFYLIILDSVYSKIYNRSTAASQELTVRTDHTKYICPDMSLH